MDNKRDFKGVWISKDVWLDKRLNALKKVILTEIDSLDSEEDGCFASNEYLAEFCQCSVSKITSAISKLKYLEYIYVKSFDGRTRILGSRLTNFGRQTAKKTQADTQILEHNNKSNNIDEYKIIINYLNSATSSNYRYQSKATQRLINARLNDGFTVDDFKAVIDKKAKEWKGTEMAQYLRPETLFGTKFESYLNAPKASRKTAQATFDERTYTKDELNKAVTPIDELANIEW